MLRVAGVSSATETQLAALTAKARQMGRDTRYSASEAGEAGTAGASMPYLWPWPAPTATAAKSGSFVDTIAIGGVLNVAAVANADMGRTSDIVSNVLTGFGLQASQANRVGDVLTKTFTGSDTTLESLGETLKYVAPVATGVMGDAGIQGSMAGTALRSMFLRMIDPAKSGQKALDKDGGCIDAAVKNARAQGQSEEQVNILRERLEKSSKLQDRYRQNQLASEEGFAAKVAARMESGTGGALRVFRSGVEDLAISIGDVLSPTIKFGAQSLGTLANTASELVQRFPVLS